MTAFDSVTSSSSAADQPVSTGEALFINDEPKTKDRLDFQSYTDGLVRLIASPEIGTPITLGVLGSWGSGKTSLLRQMQDALRKQGFHLADGHDRDAGKTSLRRRAHAALQEPFRRRRPGGAAEREAARGSRRFMLSLNVWQLGLEGDTRRSLLQAVLTTCRKALPLPTRLRFDGYLLRKRLDGSTLLRQLVANIYRLLLAALPVVVAAHAPLAGRVDPSLGWLTSGVLGFWLVIKPAVDAAREKVSLDLGTLLKEREYELRVSVLQRLQEDFETLVEMWVGKSGRLVVFVDDLDRCAPQQIPGVLEAIKLFLTAKGCVYVLALDQEVVARSIELRYSRPFGARPEGPTFDGMLYLEKMVQLPFALPSIESGQIQNYIDSFGVRWPDDPSPASGSPPTSLSRLVFVRGLPRNPRQIKRSINVFLLLWKLAESRQVGEYVTPGRLAKVVALQTAHAKEFAELKKGPAQLRLLEVACNGGNPQALPEELREFAASPDGQRLFRIPASGDEADPSAPASFGGMTEEQLKTYFFDEPPHEERKAFPEGLNEGQRESLKRVETFFFKDLTDGQLEAFFSLASRVPVRMAQEETPAPDWAELVNRYQQIRTTQLPGPARTATMTGVMGEMIRLMRSLPEFPVDQALVSKIAGERLIGYAALYARPEPEVLKQLVETVTTREDQAFAQYWGLQAIEKVIAEATKLPANKQPMSDTELRAQLEEFHARDRVKRDQDLHRTLERILGARKHGTGAP